LGRDLNDGQLLEFVQYFGNNRLIFFNSSLEIMDCTDCEIPFKKLKMVYAI